MKKYIPLVTFLKAEGLRFKSIEIDQIHVEYFRIDELNQILQDKQQYIQRNNVLKHILEGIKWNQILDYYQREQGAPKYRRPDSLVKVPTDETENHNQQKEKYLIQRQQKFASFRFPTIQEGSKKILYVVTGCILLLSLHPFWPYQLKYGIFIMASLFLSSIAVIFLLRILIFFYCRGLNKEVWLFPSIITSEQISKTFTPIISIEKWKGSVFRANFQIICTFIILFVVWYTNNEDSSTFNAIKILIQDFLHWGDAIAKGQIGSSLETINDQI